MVEGLTFKELGTPNAKPKSGFCPIDGCQPLNLESGFCEVDWRWEAKSHMSSVMHGLIKDAEGRHEPIIQASAQSPVV